MAAALLGVALPALAAPTVEVAAPEGAYGQALGAAFAELPPQLGNAAMTFLSSTRQGPGSFKSILAGVDVYEAGVAPSKFEVERLGRGIDVNPFVAAQKLKEMAQAFDQVLPQAQRGALAPLERAYGLARARLTESQLSKIDELVTRGTESWRLSDDELVAVRITLLERAQEASLQRATPREKLAPRAAAPAAPALTDAEKDHADARALAAHLQYVIGRLRAIVSNEAHDRQARFAEMAAELAARNERVETRPGMSDGAKKLARAFSEALLKSLEPRDDATTAYGVRAMQRLDAVSQGVSAAKTTEDIARVVGAQSSAPAAADARRPIPAWARFLQGASWGFAALLSTFATLFVSLLPAVASSLALGPSIVIGVSVVSLALNLLAGRGVVEPGPQLLRGMWFLSFATVGTAAYTLAQVGHPWAAILLAGAGGAAHLQLAPTRAHGALSSQALERLALISGVLIQAVVIALLTNLVFGLIYGAVMLAMGARALQPTPKT